MSLSCLFGFHDFHSVLRLEEIRAQWDLLISCCLFCYKIIFRITVLNRIIERVNAQLPMPKQADMLGHQGQSEGP